MAAFTRSLVTASFVVLLLHLISAQECNLQNLTNFEYWTLYVSNQRDLEIPELQGCTTIVGSISIRSSYTGPFVLSGISNITEAVSVDDSDEDATVDNHITSVEMDNLTYLHDLYFSRVPNLTSINFPKLATISELSIDASQLSNVDFRSLLNATSLTISGNITIMDFAVLTEISNRLYIGSTSQYDSYTPVPPGSAPLDITFPSLRNASGIYLSGNISNISMPSLTSALQTDYGDGLQIETGNLPLNISFPILSQAEGIYLSGGIESLSFPSLANLAGDFTLDSDSPLALNLTNFIRINGSISIWGNITSVAFPNLDFLSGNLGIYSDLPLDCHDAYSAWMRANISTAFQESEHIYSCKGTSKPKSHPSKLALGLGIGLGVGIPLLALLVYLERWSSGREKRRGGRRKYGGMGGVELGSGMGAGNTGVSRGEEFESGGETERGSLHSEDTAVEDLREGDRRGTGTGDVRSGEDGAIR